MTLKVRKPTGAVPWPVVLIEGPEKSGKSWAIAELSASKRVGQTYWIDIGEGAADEYGAVPGADYLVVEHGGDFNEIIQAVEEIRAIAQHARDNGEKPVVLGVDSMTEEWEILKGWASARAARSKANRDRLSRDPNAEVKVSMNLWNDATAKHRRLITLLLTFPGIVVVTARGKEVVAVEDGKPVEGQREYKVEGHKTLAFDASVWVRLSRDAAPMVVGCRSVHHGIRPGVDAAKRVPNFTVDWLVFDLLKCDPDSAHVRDLPQSEIEQVRARVWELALAKGWDAVKLAADYAECHEGQPIGEATTDDLSEYAVELEEVPADG